MAQPAVSHLLPHLYIYLHFIIIIILTFSSSSPFSSQQGSPHHHPRAQRTQTQPCYPSWKYFNSSFVSGFLLLELCSLCGVVFIWLWYISIELMYNNFIIAITLYTPNPFNLSWIPNVTDSESRAHVRFYIQTSWRNTAPRGSHIYCLSIVDFSTTSVSDFLPFIKLRTIYEYEFTAKSISHLWLIIRADKYALI